MHVLVHPLYLLVGSIVTVRIKGLFGLVTHYGIISHLIGQDGLPMVIANSRARRGPALVTWSEFTAGEAYKEAYYPSDLPNISQFQSQKSYRVRP
jgi:hypothetical protein